MKSAFKLLIQKTMQFISRAETLSRGAVLRYALLMTIGLAVIDYFTTPDYAFTIFYILPVSFAAWFSGRNDGLRVSIICVLASFFVHTAWPNNAARTLVPYWDALTELLFFTITTLTLAELKSTIQREMKMARTDHLTGLDNSRYFYELAEREAQRARRQNTALTVAYMDLDGFKLVNDTYGHLEGDQVLKVAAEGLKHSVRGVDVVARMGGDEFVVLMPDTDMREAAQTVERLKSALLARLRSNNSEVTVSIGAVTCEGEDCSVEGMVKTADCLMYEAKTSGKNRIVHRTLKNGTACELAAKPVSNE